MTGKELLLFLNTLSENELSKQVFLEGEYETLSNTSLDENYINLKGPWTK